MGKATKKNNCETKKNNCEPKKKTLKNKTNLEQSGGALEELKNVFIEDINVWKTQANINTYFNNEQSVEAIVDKYKTNNTGLSDPLNHEKILPILNVAIQPDLFIWGANATNHLKTFNDFLNGDGQAGPFAPYEHDGKAASHPNYLGIITTQFIEVSTHNQVLLDINTKFDYLERYVKNGGKVHIPRDHKLYDESVAAAKKAVDLFNEKRKEKLEKKQIKETEKMIKETEKMISKLNDSIVTIQMGLGAGLAEGQQDLRKNWIIQQDLLYYRVAKLCVLTLQDKLDHIDDFLHIYTYLFLPKPIIDSIKVQVTKEAFKTKLFSAVLILPKKPDDETIRRDIKQHLLFRHPVHYGLDDKWSWINESNFMSIFGYSKKLVYLFDANVRGKLRLPSSNLGDLVLPSSDNTTCPGDTRLEHLWYGILGWTDWVHKEVVPTKTDEYNQYRPTKDGAYILHTWGVNLENDRTPHYKFCYSSNIHENPQPKTLIFGQFNEANYKRLLNNTLGVIRNAISHLTLTEKDKIIQVRITKLGFGAWKAQIPPTNQEPLLKYYKDTLLSMHKDNVVITFLDWDKKSSETSTSTGWKLNAIEDNHTDPFGKYIGNDDVLLLVNAWDDASFVGNGGLWDDTLDGWMVTGAVGKLGINGQPLGHYAQNYSYFHNVFFQPQLLNEANWKWGEGKVEKVEKVEKVKLNTFMHGLEALVDMLDNPEVKLGESDKKKAEQERAGEEEIKKDSPQIESLNLYERLVKEFEKNKHRYTLEKNKIADRNKKKVLIINEVLNKKKEKPINELVQIANKIDATDGITAALKTALDNMDAAAVAVAKANVVAKPYLDEQEQAMAAANEAFQKNAKNHNVLREAVKVLIEQFATSEAKQQLKAAEDTEELNILQFYKSFDAWVESIKKNMKGVVEDLLDTEPTNQMVIDLANAFDIESKTKRLARKQAEMERAHREEIKSIASGSIAGIDDMRFDIESHKNINLTNYYDILISQAQNMNRSEYEHEINAKFVKLETELEELRKTPKPTNIDKAIAEAMGVMIDIGKKIKDKILEIMGTIENYDKTKFEQLNKTILKQPKSFDKSTQEIIAISKVMIKRIRDYNQSSFDEDEEYLNIENMKTMIEILTIKMNANDANEITTLEAKKVVHALQKVFDVNEPVKEPTNFKNPLINNQMFAVAIAKGFTNYENYERILHKHVILKQRKIEMNNYMKLNSDILDYKQLLNNEEKEKMYSSLISRKDEFNDLDYYSGFFSVFNEPIKRAAEEVAEQQVFIIDFLKDKDLKDLENLEIKDTPQAFQQLFAIATSIDEEPIPKTLNDVVKAFHVANVAQAALYAARAANAANAANAAQAEALVVDAYDKYREWVDLIKTKVIEIANKETWTTDSAKKIIAALLFAFDLNQTDVSNFAVYEQFIVKPAEEDSADQAAEEERERARAAEEEREQADRAAEAERKREERERVEQAAEAERLAKEADTKYYQNLSEAIARGFNTYKEMNIYKDSNRIYSGYEYYDAYTHIKEDNTIENITNQVFIDKLTKDIETTTYDIEAVERGIISKPPEYLATLNAQLIMLKTKKFFADKKISSEDEMNEKLSPDVISVVEFAYFMGDKAKEFDDIEREGPKNPNQRAARQFNATTEAIKVEAEWQRWEGESLTIIVAALLSSFKILATITNHELYEKFIPKQKTQEETQEAYKHDAFAVAKGFFTYDEMLSILEDGTIMEGKVKKKYANIKNYYDTIPIYVQTTDDQEIDTEIKILTEILVRLNTALEHSKDKVMIDAKIEMVSARRNILDGVFEANKESTDEARNAAIKKAFKDKTESPKLKDIIFIAREIQNVALSAEKEIIEDALTQMNGKQDGILKNSIILGFKKALQLDDPEQEPAVNLDGKPAAGNLAGNLAEKLPAGKKEAKPPQTPAAGNLAGNLAEKLPAGNLAGNLAVKPAGNLAVKPAGNLANVEQAGNLANVEQAGNLANVEQAGNLANVEQVVKQKKETQPPDQQNTRAILSTIYQEETSSSYMFYIPIVGILIAISSVFLIK